MTVEEFKRALHDAAPPDGVNAPLRGLWHDARGDWDAAHRLAQDVDDDDGAWVHAYLHRKEGDAGNAAYWYERAHQAVATDALDSEWERLARWLLDRSAATA
jgi:hypothetical protein